MQTEIDYAQIVTAQRENDLYIPVETSTLVNFDDNDIDAGVQIQNFRSNSELEPRFQWIPAKSMETYFMTLHGRWFNERMRIFEASDGQKFYITLNKEIIDIKDESKIRSLKRDEPPSAPIEIRVTKRNRNE